MRPFISAPFLGLFLLGACAEPQHLLSEPPAPAALAAPSSLSGVARSQLSLHIGNGFTADEEAKIVAAVADWNRNGSVRFEVAPRTYSAAEPGAWTIVKPNPASYARAGEWRVEPVAVTNRLSGGGGSIVVTVERLGTRDLRGIIVQELNVAAGGDVRFASAAR